MVKSDTQEGDVLKILCNTINTYLLFLKRDFECLFSIIFAHAKLSL